MVKLVMVLALSVLAAGVVVGCHAEGHADDSGVGAHVGLNH